ncbi:MAG: NAD(P)/FAD-dependent oxidoreductase [Syntrophomonadaceae bacterium]|jgi:thioredoxin reductase (NADPH)|nr:NAD(P)/FAD-dependent oxidoreductase [Syntrophomonadaceae bacterium]
MSERTVYDVAVIGCGPAGLSAAINVKVRNRTVVVLGTEVCSPPLNKAPRIENYLGFPGVAGAELRDNFVEHTTSMGIEIKRDKVDAILPEDDGFMITTREEVIRAQTVVMATGIPYRPRLRGEAEFLGRGLSYCATCDGPLYRDKDIAIIAHSTEAEVEANYMAEICRQVFYLPLYDGMANLEPEIKVIEGKPTRVIGDNTVTELHLGEERLKVDGVFIVGAETPPESLFPGLKMDNNHIAVDRNMQTSIPGLYAGGDCTGPPYQVAKSVGEGQIAGLNAAKLVVAKRSKRKPK